MSTSTETYGRGLYVGVLAVASLLSVAGNAVYAYAAPATVEPSLSPGWAAAAHMVPPVLLLLVTEVLAMASTKFDGPGRAWALAGVVVIAGAAFALSFDALYAVAEMAKVRSSLAWLVPVMLDASIIVCTILVLMASRRMQRDRAAADALAASVGVQSEPAQSVEQSRLSSAHPLVQAVAQTSSGDDLNTSGAQEPTEVLNGSDQSTDQSAELDLSDFDDDVLRRLERDDPDWLSGLRIEIGEHTEQSVEHGVEQPAQTIEQAIEQTPEPVSEHRVEQRSDEVLNSDMELRTLAERAHRELTPKVSVETLTELIAAHREGATQRQLGEIAGVSPNTAVKYVHAAERLAS
ncbi:DUF2637 domain-containing protein [Gordonia malaquae]|uniref:DUF2637 domain-containing protein n=1 Tax=Gordonia malaquae TaxID=410332 RepID=UPI0030C78F5E